MRNRFFKLTLAAAMVALSTVGASAAGIGIIIGPTYRPHHPPHFVQRHHRVCRFDRFGHRHCFWR